MSRNGTRSGSSLRSVFLFALMLMAIFSRQSDAQDLQRRLRDSVDVWHKRNPATGLAVGVLHHGATVFAHGFGTRRLGFDSAVTTRTLFHMASVSKQFTATAVLQLVERGKVALDSPVTHYLPYFRLKDPRAARITVRQLLNHTSGLPDVTDYRWSHPETDSGALERFVRGLSDSVLVFAPGSDFQYSNIAFEVAADLVSKVSGMPFEDYEQQKILTPSGMKHSTFLMTDIDSANLAWPHAHNNKGVARALGNYTYNRSHAGSGTLHSNVDDMLSWANVLLHGGQLNGKKVMNAATVNMMWASTVDRTEQNNIQAYLNATPTPFDGYGYALGWRWYRFGGRRLVGHSGQDDGFRVDILIAPHDSTAIVVLTNDLVGGPAELSRILYKVTQASDLLHRQAELGHRNRRRPRSVVASHRD